MSQSNMANELSDDYHIIQRKNVGKNYFSTISNLFCLMQKLLIYKSRQKYCFILNPIIIITIFFYINTEIFKGMHLKIENNEIGYLKIIIPPLICVNTFYCRHKI